LSQNGTGDLGGKSGVAEQLVHERRENLLPGDASESEAIGGFPLPDVEGSMLGG
jgi:hypothetical protein